MVFPSSDIGFIRGLEGIPEEPTGFMAVGGINREGEACSAEQVPILGPSRLFVEHQVPFRVW